MKNGVGGQCAHMYETVGCRYWVREVRSCKRNATRKRANRKSVLSYTDPTHDDTMCLRLPALSQIHSPARYACQVKSNKNNATTEKKETHRITKRYKHKFSALRSKRSSIA